MSSILNQNEETQKAFKPQDNSRYAIPSLQNSNANMLIYSNLYDRNLSPRRFNDYGLLDATTNAQKDVSNLNDPMGDLSLVMYQTGTKCADYIQDDDQLEEDQQINL